MPPTRTGMSFSGRHSPQPFTEFVVKIHQRCNLACDYCYMYELADQTWRDRPPKMSTELFEVFVTRLVEHVHAHDLSEIKLVLHGGEPLLRGRDFITWAVSLVRTHLEGVDVDVRVQTNGVHLDNQMLAAFRKHHIAVGISLDGDRIANDRHRVKRNGESSFDATVAGINRIVQSRYRNLFRGIYATIDLCNDPIETYEFLMSFSPPMIDFFLPHGTWENPPPRPDGDSATAYAEWLIPIFDSWYTDRPTQTSIRYFHNIIVGLIGGTSESETIGLGPSCTTFVDTDGSIGQVDSLKVAYEGATETGLTIIDNTFDEATAHAANLVRQAGKSALCTTCQECKFVDVCGGGYYPHRYRANNGFDNPSVYCRDLMMLIEHISRRVKQDKLPIELSNPKMSCDMTEKGTANVK